MQEYIVGDTVLKTDLFRALGYNGSYDLMELILEEEGLSRPTKQRISVAKIDRVAEILAEHFIAVCTRGDCKAEVNDPEEVRIVVPATTPMNCEICQGSINAKAVDEMVRALQGANVRRMCVVGGSPASHRKLQDLIGDRLGLRLVDGTKSRTLANAKADLEWADLVVIWGGTMLGHRVSRHYIGPHVIQIARRSIRNLAKEVARSDIVRAVRANSRERNNKSSRYMELEDQEFRGPG